MAERHGLAENVPFLKRLGTALIVRRPLSRFIQIDRLAAVHTGLGSATTASFHLLHGRYTLFVDYDPPAAVTSFALVDDQNRPQPDWSKLPVNPGGVIAPLVQHELAGGNYRLMIGTANPTCAWRVQVVLNSMLSWHAPPPAWRPAGAPPSEIIVRSGDNPAFRITQTGTYSIDWTVGPAQFEGHPIRSYWLDIRASDGHVIHLGGTPTPDRDERSGFTFLGAGDWTVDMETSFDWRLRIVPMVGSSGGGARWF